jgi:ligand-binding SRPBCC domain-containing protein
MGCGRHGGEARDGMRAIAAFAALAIGATDRWGRRTRATAAERQKRLPGDELVTDPMWQATRAVTIDAPPEMVWPWLVQMGFPTKRAGWYTPFWLDRLLFGIHVRSASRIVPELQALAVGDRVDDSDSGVAYFEVAALDRPRALVLVSHTHPLPAYENVDFSWAFVLEDVGATRLIMRSRVRYAPVWPPWLVRLLVVVGFGIGDFVQGGAMLQGIRSRVLSSPPHASAQSRRMSGRLRSGTLQP